MEKVSIIVVTYNGLQWIEKCLQSILPSYDVIVVDNNSTDGTLSIIEEKFSKVKVLAQKVNLGFGQANNIGISYAINKGADYVFLLNQDAYLKKNTISKLVELSGINKEYGVLSPIHLNGAGTKLDLNFSCYIQNNKELQYDALKNHFTNQIYDVPFVNAAGWLIPKEIIEIVGGFDPIFFHYGEDDNFCQRVLFHGYKIGIAPEVYMMHDREYRKPKINNSVAEYLKNLERRYKLELANINVNFNSNISQKDKLWLKKILKYLLKFDFNLVNRCIKERKVYKKVIPAIIQSRELNKTKGAHYIDLLNK